MKITVSHYQDPDVEIELQKIDDFGEPRRFRVKTVAKARVFIESFPATGETEAYEAYDRLVSERLEALR